MVAVEDNSESKGRYRKKGVDLTGMRFGNLVAIRKVRLGYSKYRWECLCDCGNITLVRTDHLVSGDIKSCGCLHFQACVTHGMSDSRIYHIWCTMKARCNRPSSLKYSSYGGRGIKLCAEWQNFESFYKWSMENGYNDKLSIDRIDNDGDYCPENCRWATMKQQANNTRTNRLLMLNGEEKTLAEWAESYSIKTSIVHKRLKRGWGLRDALGIPVGSILGGSGRGYKQFLESTGR